MEEAEAELQRAADIDRGNGDVNNNLAETQTLIRKYSNASRTFELATSLDSHNVVWQGWRAWVNVQWHGDVAAAEQVLKKAAEVPNPEDPYGSVTYFSVRRHLSLGTGRKLFAA